MTGIVLLFSVLLNFGYVSGLNQAFSFSVLQVCYQLYNDVIRDIDGVRSTTACSAICAEDDCCSFLFDEGTGRCITYVYNATSISTGCEWKYGEMNLEICRQPRYTPSSPNTCNPGYTYDVTYNKCQKYCTSYGTTFGPGAVYLLTALNNDVIYNSTEDACKDACIAATDYVCRSAELNNNDGRCLLSEETGLTQPQSFNPNTALTHWTRNCA